MSLTSQFALSAKLAQTTLGRRGLFALAGGLAVAVASPSSAQVSPAPDSVPVAPAEIGWEFLGSRVLNEGEIPEVQYEGECPGTDEGHVEARFISSETATGDRRRVIVRNVTRGVDSDPYPYTDREYEEGTASEETRMVFGLEHSRRRFRVLEGENEFEYEIWERDQVIDSGSFTANIYKFVDIRRRDASASTAKVCMNSSVPMNLCADVRTRTTYRCPGSSRDLRRTLEPSDPTVYTMLANQSTAAVNYWLNGQLYRLQPGQSTTVSGNRLTVEFEPGCSRSGGFQTCLPPQSQPIQPGRRYQFRASWGSGVIELQDFPR